MPNTAAGGTHYDWLDSYTEEYGENGSSCTAHVMTDWSDRSAFPINMLGTVSRSGAVANGQQGPPVPGAITRTIPEKHPDTNRTWWCTRCKLLNGVGSFEEVSNLISYYDASKMPHSGGKAIWEVEFSSVNFTIKRDGGAGGELGRYIERKREFSSESLELPGNTFKFDESITGENPPVIINEPSTKLFPTTRLTYVWHWVPLPLPAAISTSQGMVNSAIFDSSYEVAPIGTVLYIAPHVETITLPDGTLAANVSLEFVRRDTGWNNFYRMKALSNGQGGNPGFDPVVARAGTGKPYPTMDLNTLFT